MKFYIASHTQFSGIQASYSCIKAGHKITSHWLLKPFHPTSSHTIKERQNIAQEDFDDITEADALILLACQDKVSGGKFVEAGIALGQNKPVFIIGRRENMLLWLKNIKQYDTIEELLKDLATPV